MEYELLRLYNNLKPRREIQTIIFVVTQPSQVFMKKNCAFHGLIWWSFGIRHLEKVLNTNKPNQITREELCSKNIHKTAKTIFVAKAVLVGQLKTFASST